MVSARKGLAGLRKRQDPPEEVAERVCLCSLLPLPQVLAFRADGFQSPPSNEDLVTMPSMPAPILTSAQAWGPTTGQATATAPDGSTFMQASRIANLLQMQGTATVAGRCSQTAVGWSPVES